MNLRKYFHLCTFPQEIEAEIRPAAIGRTRLAMSRSPMPPVPVVFAKITGLLYVVREIFTRLREIHA